MARDKFERLPYTRSDSVSRHRLPMLAPSASELSSAESQSFNSRNIDFNAPTSRSLRSFRSSASFAPLSKLYFLPKPRTIIALLKFALPATLLISFMGLYMYQPHVEIAFYDRNWVHNEIETTAPLSGCFDEDRASSTYNVSQFIFGPKSNEVQAGMSLKLGLDCYDFAGTIQKVPQVSPASGLRTEFHTYWRNDLAPFGPRQEWMLKSFFATQNINATRLILWSNGDLSTNAILQKYTKQYPNSFALRVVDIPALAKGTELDGSSLLTRKDTRAWIDGDLIRLLLLWNYGGIWVDMDSLLTRDLEPLLEHEFVTQWDCYDKIYLPLNGALMRFRQHSPYLCEAFHIMATSPAPRSGSTDWGALLYLKLWRRLVAASIPPFKILPFCFTDGRSCRLDNRLPDPFAPDHSSGKWTMGLGLEEGGGLDKVLGKIFGIHLHNQWEKEYPHNGWVERLLLRKYEGTLMARSLPQQGEL